MFSSLSASYASYGDFSVGSIPPHLIQQAQKPRPNSAIPTPVPNTHVHLKYSLFRKQEIGFKKRNTKA